MWESVREIVNNENDFLYNFIDERPKNWNGFIEDVEEIVVGVGNDKIVNEYEVKCFVDIDYVNNIKEIFTAVTNNNKQKNH